MGEIPDSGEREEARQSKDFARYKDVEKEKRELT